MQQARVFGAYVPGSSMLHRMNTQVKIILTCVFSICAFLVDSWEGMAVLCVSTVLLYLLAHVKLRSALSGIGVVVFIMAFTLLAHMFTGDVGDLAAVQAQPGALQSGIIFSLGGSFGLTLDGAFAGAFLALRIALLVFACSLLTFTSSVADITAALSGLLSPLGRLHVPVEDVSMIVSIALRFIPTITESARTVKQAQEARGARFDGGPVLERVKAWALVLAPLFVRLFKTAETLSVAMDARCYGVRRRADVRTGKMDPADLLVLVAAGAPLVAVAVFL